MSETLPPDLNRHLFGHGVAEARFVAALERGRLPHAWLLTGPRGVGKATLAYRLARRLLAGKEGEAAASDPRHRIFRMVAKRAHPDLRVLKREINPKTGKLRAEIIVDQVRAANEALRSTAALGGRRVLLVDWADELNEEAANAFLKLLEEPPTGVVLILVAQRPGQLPPTIASRCARLPLRPLAPAELTEALRVLAPEAEEARLAGLVSIADGSPGRALMLLRSGWLETYGQVLERLASGGPKDRLAAAELLVKHAQGTGPVGGAELIGELVRRLAHRLAGAEAPELVPGERERLDRIARALTLDRCAAVWEKLGALTERLEAVNLDPFPTFLQIVDSVGAERRGA